MSIKRKFLIVLILIFVLAMTIPVSAQVVCYGNEVMVNGVCYPQTCARGEVWRNGLCVRAGIYHSPDGTYQIMHYIHIPLIWSN